MPMILQQDWTLVTRNSEDFRGQADRPGTRGLYADVPLHGGLICLNSSFSLDREGQLLLFAELLKHLRTHGELLNEVLEINVLDIDGSFNILRYKLPE